MSHILLTGGSGFLGKIIRNTLSEYSFATMSRQQTPEGFDLSVSVPHIEKKPDIVIHAAGKAHIVPGNEQEIQEFFDVNVRGTLNLLKGLEISTLPKSFVFISSVAIYGRAEGINISEKNEASAIDPYGLSKIEAEQIVQKWGREYNVNCAILRLPLLAGACPPGNLKSMIKGIKNGYYFDIAGGRAKKSMVLAEDVARIIPKAAEIGGMYNLTDGYHPSFSELSALIASQLGKNKPLNIPKWMAIVMAKAGDIFGPKAPINSDKLKKITSDLTFDDSKARQLLGWNPTPVLEGFKIH